MKSSIVVVLALSSVIVVIGIISSLVLTRPWDKEIIFDFLFVNDVHLDIKYVPNGLPQHPYYCQDPEFLHENSTHEYGQYNCDTPNATFMSMLEVVPRFCKDPKFIIFGGDAPAHGLGLNEEEHKALVENVVNQIGNIYPNIPLFFSLGNNDFFKNYGSFETDSTDFKKISTFTRLALKGEQLDTFLKGGYYYYDYIEGNLRIIVLNTVAYSTVRAEINDTDPHGQFSWLRKTIIDAQNKDLQILITMHIPPGYSDVKASQGWHTKYIDIFDKIVKEYKIENLLVGHSHYDLFMPIFGETGQSKGYTLSSPSISPSHNNNPAFRVYTVSSKRGLIDYAQYYGDILMNPKHNELKWDLEYRFSEAYGMPDLGNESIRKAARWVIETSRGKWSYKAKMTALAMDNWAYYYCMLKATTTEQANLCKLNLDDIRLPITPYDE